MKVHNLHVNVEVSDLGYFGYRMRRHLIATLVPYQDDERPVIFLDAIIDQRRYAWVELFPHVALHQRRRQKRCRSAPVPARDRKQKNKAVGRSRMIDRHNPILPSETRPQTGPRRLISSSTSQVQVRFSHRRTEVILTGVSSQHGFARASRKNSKAFRRDHLQPRNAFGSPGRIHCRTSHPSFERQRVLRIQRRETSSTRKYTQSHSPPSPQNGVINADGREDLRPA